LRISRRASTGARSRSAPTSDARLRASHAASSPSNSTTAVGIAKLRRARARRSTPLSACWRGCSSMSVPSGLRRRLRRPEGEARSTCSSVVSSDGARLLQRRSPARRAHPRCLACRREPAAGRRSMAPRSRARRGPRLPVRRVGGRAESVEHAPGTACAPLVRVSTARTELNHSDGEAERSIET